MGTEKRNKSCNQYFLRAKCASKYPFKILIGAINILQLQLLKSEDFASFPCILNLGFGLLVEQKDGTVSRGGGRKIDTG